MSDPTFEVVEIERLVYGGDGLARRDGKTVFVPQTLPGERARIEIVERHESYDRGRLVAIEAPSPRRIAPACEYFGRCGGCQWQHAPADYQAELKLEILRETLRRTGGLEWSAPVALHAGPAWAYRNRARLRVSGAAEAPRLAYFARDSHTLVPVTHCPIAAPAVENAIAALAALPPPPPGVREIEIMTDAAGAKLCLNLEAEKAGTLVRAYASEAEEMAGAAGEGIEYAAGGRDYWVARGAFFQANRFLLEELIAAVTAPAAAAGCAVDLFSGVGLFALPLAERFANVSAVENHPAAVASLRRNAAGLAQLRVHDLAAEEFMARWSGPLDLLVADPPRAGLGRKLVAAIAAARPRELRYLSCDPATLARDLKQLLAAAPYRLAALHLFDLFPQTFHIETLAVLQLAA